MAGYATKLIAVMADLKTAVDGITAANGYDVAIATSTTDVLESPFDRSQSEFPRTYIYLKPEDTGSVERVDLTGYEARFTTDIDTWVHCQDNADVLNLPKYAAAVMYAVESWRLSDSLGAEMDVEPVAVSYHYQDKRKCVVRVTFNGSVRFVRSDR